MESIIASLITGGLALLGIIITNSQSNKAIENKLVTAQAVTDEKLDQLYTEVKRHNNFAERIPVIEEKVSSLEHRVDNLEKSRKDMYGR